MQNTAQRKYSVTLTETERQFVLGILTKGVSKARVITRARILLLTSEGRIDKEICQALGIERSTVHDIRRKYADGGLQNALQEKPRPGKERLLTVSDEAMVTAIACSNPKPGYSQWTIDLLTEEFNKKVKHQVSRNTIWRVLLRNNLKPWLKKNVVYSQSDSRV